MVLPATNCAPLLGAVKLTLGNWLTLMVMGAEVAELGIVGESEYVVAFLNIEYAQSKFYMSLGGFAALKPLARRFLRIIHVGVNRWCIGY